MSEGDAVDPEDGHGGSNWCIGRRAVGRFVGRRWSRMRTNMQRDGQVGCDSRSRRERPWML